MAENITKAVAGQAFLEFNLQLPTEMIAPFGHAIALETQQIVETVSGYNEADISFRVTNPMFLDQILKALNANGNPIIHWRLGLGTGDAVEWIPWQTYYVLQYTSRFEGVGPGAGHYIKLFTRDLLHLLDRASRTQAHRGTIGAVVTKLATDNGFNDSVIEATHGEGIWIQSYEGDFEFVRKRLVARARSTRGRGNYYLFVRDDVVHFHTIEYQTKVKDFAYYLSPATRMEATDAVQAKISAGSAGTRVTYYDPFKGEAKDTTSDPTQAIRMGNWLPHLDKREQRNIREHNTAARDANAGSQALAQNAYESARSECFQLKMQTSKTAIIRPGELLRINIDPNAETTSSWSGIYLVAKAQHILEKGEINSVYILQRGEQLVARISSDKMAAYGVSTLISAESAPGYDLNIREMKSSSLTKGAGKIDNDGAILTVQDRNKAVNNPTRTYSPKPRLNRSGERILRVK